MEWDKQSQIHIFHMASRVLDVQMKVVKKKSILKRWNMKRTTTKIKDF